MDFQELQDYLFGLRAKGSRLGLERMEALANALNHPERNFPCIHVAGTNGKGSTSAMLEAIYRASELTVGLYTSPHLEHLGERVQVNRMPMSETEIFSAVASIKPIVEKVAQKDETLHATFFEFMTALAFLQFTQKNVDLAIIETGLGGRLDSTNVVSPLLSVITSIGLDHQEFLGESIEEIAFEKSGIIKENTSVVIGMMPESAEKVIRSVAAEKHAKVFSVRERFGDSINAYFPKTNLRGSFQRVNAAIASLSVEVLNQHFPVKPETVASALNHVRWDGRWQEIKISEKTTLILDGSHNEEGILNIEELLSEWVEKTGQKPIIITSSMLEYRARKMFPILGKFAKELCFIEVNAGRGLTIAEMMDYASDVACPKRGVEWHDIFKDNGSIKDEFLAGNILVTGSLYLVGEFLQHLHHKTEGVFALQDKL